MPFSQHRNFTCLQSEQLVPQVFLTALLCLRAAVQDCVEVLHVTPAHGGGSERVRFIALSLVCHMHKMFIATAQVVSRRPLTAETRIHSQASPCDIYGVWSGTCWGFPLNIYSFAVRFFNFLFPLFYLLLFRFPVLSFLWFLIYLPPYIRFFILPSHRLFSP